MVDEKDRLGERLKEKEQAEEDRFFRQRDEEALARLRQQQTTAAQPKATCQCPKDGSALATVEQHGVKVEECPTCHGVWLDAGELERLAERERDSWLGRLFFRPRI